MNPSSLGISIATRNRWPDVEKTLAMIAAQPELEGCPVIVIDDGSGNWRRRHFVERYPNVEFIPQLREAGRVRNSGSPIARRLENRVRPSARRRFLSHSKGSVSEAVLFLASRADIVGLALNVVSRDLVSPPIERSDPPYQVGVFIGCGVLFRREGFLRLGGYSSELGYYCEEFHFSASAAREGLAIYMFPSGCGPAFTKSRPTPEVPGRSHFTRVAIACFLSFGIILFPPPSPTGLPPPSRNPRLGAAARFSGRDRRFLDGSFRRGPNVGQAPAAQPGAVQILAPPALVFSAKKYRSFDLENVSSNPLVFPRLKCRKAFFLAERHAVRRPRFAGWVRRSKNKCAAAMSPNRDRKIDAEMSQSSIMLRTF